MGDRRAATIHWLEGAFEGRADLDVAGEHLPSSLLEQFGAADIAQRLASISDGRRVQEVRPGGLPISVHVTLTDEDGSRPPLHIECLLDETDRLLGVNVLPAEHAHLVVRTEPTESLSPAERQKVHALFDEAYEQASHAYLDLSLATLRWISMASDDQKLVGFSLGEQRQLELPRVGATRTTLAGLACVDPGVRRRGLFRRLSNLVLAADGVLDQAGGRVLNAGRMAHPASYRVYRPYPTVVPKDGAKPNEFQQEVGAVVARAYGVDDFDPQTFVCRGKGAPIGYPKMTQDVDPNEWEIFAAVDRDRGDALLAVIWQPTPPDGWMEPAD